MSDPASDAETDAQHTQEINLKFNAYIVENVPGEKCGACKKTKEKKTLKQKKLSHKFEVMKENWLSLLSSILTKVEYEGQKVTARTAYGAKFTLPQDKYVYFCFSFSSSHSHTLQKSI
jgi:hypothetical protein